MSWPQEDSDTITVAEALAALGLEKPRPSGVNLAAAEEALASWKETTLKSAFRDTVKRHHPDTCGLEPGPEREADLVRRNKLTQRAHEARDRLMRLKIQANEIPIKTMTVAAPVPPPPPNYAPDRHADYDYYNDASWLEALLGVSLCLRPPPPPAAAREPVPMTGLTSTSTGYTVNYTRSGCPPRPCPPPCPPPCSPASRPLGFVCTDASGRMFLRRPA